MNPPRPKLAMPLSIGLLLFPKLTQLDLIGPLQVMTRIPDARVELVWKTTEPVTDESGRLRLIPTADFEGAGQLDVICVPGGPGQVELMTDEETLAFLRRQAEHARYVTSVCTGSLVLGAAGLLRGYRATCHWLSLDQLPLFGAIPVKERVVFDRNRVTGGGVTSGIDFGLALAAELIGAEAAKTIQLQIEYDPDPPFAAGSPETAESAIVESVRGATATFLSRRRAISEQAAAALARRGW
jgi:cyclohexyl-isocyanide hydratase